MSYKQLKSFNQSTAGKDAGYCLRNVRRGYGINGKYPTAIEAWKYTQQHKDGIPANRDVPLFYTYKTDGHLNVQLANGKVWSDGTIYANIQDYLNKHKTVHYLGWGESINGVAVLQPVSDAGVLNATIELNGPDAQHWNVRSTPEVLDDNILGDGKTPAKGGQRYAANILPSGWAEVVFTGKKGYLSPKAFTRV